MDIRFYQIENKYIDYLSPHAPHLFHNKQAGQQNERKYIGIVLQVLKILQTILWFAVFSVGHAEVVGTVPILKTSFGAI